MVQQCPLCPKQFTTKAAIRLHTGTKYATLRKPHNCWKCSKTYCSQVAMEQHRDAPSHATMFSCDACERKFASRLAVEQHRTTHNTTAVSKKKKSGTSRKSALSPISTRGDEYSQSVMEYGLYDGDEIASWEDYVCPEVRYAPAGLVNSGGGYPRPDWDDDQDWVLCDKDCGWCGHCGDNVDF